MGVQDLVDIYIAEDNFVKAGRFSVALIGQTIKVNERLDVVFDNQEKAKEVFQEVKQKLDSLTPDDPPVLYHDNYVLISLPISAVWEYRWVLATEGNSFFPTEVKAKEYFDSLVAKVSSLKTSEVLGGISSFSCGGGGESGNVYAKDTDPTIKENPPQVGALWVNYKTLDLLVCVRNKQDKNVWKSLLNTDKVISPLTKPTFDIFGDGSAKALWTFEGTWEEWTKTYNGTPNGDVGFEYIDDPLYTKVATFNGGYVSIENGNELRDYFLDLNNSWTLSFYINPQKVSQKLARAINFGAAVEIVMGDLNQDGTIAIGLQRRTDTNSYIVDQIYFSIPTEKFTHLIFTYNGDTHEYGVFVNGEEKQFQLTNFSGSSIPDTNSYFGRSPWSSDPTFKGMLEQVRLFTRTVSAQEATTLANESGYFLTL